MPGMTVTAAHIKQARLYQVHYQDEHGQSIPSVDGLAKALRVKRSTLKNVLYPVSEEYRAANPEQCALKDEMADILDEINAAQHTLLLEHGLHGTWNSNIVKLALGKHGYSDKQSTELTGEGGGPISGKWEVEFVKP